MRAHAALPVRSKQIIPVNFQSDVSFLLIGRFGVRRVQTLGTKSEARKGPRLAQDFFDFLNGHPPPCAKHSRCVFLVQPNGPNQRCGNKVSTQPTQLTKMSQDAQLGRSGKTGNYRARAALPVMYSCLELENGRRCLTDEGG